MSIYKDIRDKLVENTDICRRPVDGLMTSVAYKNNTANLWFRLLFTNQEVVDGQIIRAKDATTMLLDFYDHQIDAMIPNLENYKIDLRAKMLDDCMDITVLVQTEGDMLDKMKDYIATYGSVYIDGQ